MRRNFTLEFWIDEGWHVGKLKEVTGVFSQGKTLEELKQNIRKAYKLLLKCDGLPESKASETGVEIEVKSEINSVKILKENEEHIKKKFGVKKIGVFGSTVTGEAYEKSDIDILVEFRKSVDFFEFLDLQYYLEELFNRKVDLITPDALKPYIKDKILKEVIYV
ncbi:MAG: nucleotidyltransferase domain-containing protein [Thermodesulfovibrionales bacterium]